MPTGCLTVSDKTEVGSTVILSVMAGCPVPPLFPVPVLRPVPLPAVPPEHALSNKITELIAAALARIVRLSKVSVLPQVNRGGRAVLLTPGRFVGWAGRISTMRLPDSPPARQNMSCVAI